MIQEAAERVRQMEQYVDMLQKAANEKPAVLREDRSIKAMLDILTHYYEGGQWLQDYELDEKGLLPEDLKRGVLAQDTLYDFLNWIQHLE